MRKAVYMSRLPW